MGIVPIYVWNHFPSADNRDGLVARSEQPVLPEVIKGDECGSGFDGCRIKMVTLEKIVRLFRIFKAVYCPSTPRHIESAALISELFKLPAPIPDRRLNAIDYGKFKGQPFSSMGPPHDYIETPYLGGESWFQCLGRWRSFFEEALQRVDGQPVLLAGTTEQPSECAPTCAME